MRNEKGQFVKGSGLKDLVGKRYGKLTVVRYDKAVNRKTYWICRCDCGTEKSIRGDCLSRIQSCGCVKKEQDIKNLHITNNHNMTHHPASQVWRGMMNRCYSPKNVFYKHYGGRGIKVCDEWHDITKFCKWMDEHQYTKELSIERVDVNGNYEPSNCTLIPRDEQALNRRNTIFVETDLGIIPMAKTAREENVDPKLVFDRYKRGIRKYSDLFYNGHLQKRQKEVFGG